MTEATDTRATAMEALEEAINVCGSATALASGIGVSSSLPSMWKTRRRVPAHYCPSIERLTREAGKAVVCERLEPDVEWDVLRLQTSPADQQQAA